VSIFDPDLYGRTKYALAIVSVGGVTIMGGEFAGKIGEAK
jgi:hypothetical protein